MVHVGGYGPAPIPESSDSTRVGDEVLDDLVTTFDI